MSHKFIHIVLAGGGTGGHLFPGLAVAECLRERLPSIRITVAGSGKPFERRHVADAQCEYLALPCQSVPRRPWQVPAFVARNLAGYLAARSFIADENVSAVVGLGGYASVPMGVAAGRAGLPVVLLEQNAVPGRATRWLSSSATMICTAMAEANRHLRGKCPVRTTGNPIRKKTAFPKTCRKTTLGGWLGHSEAVPQAGISGASLTLSRQPPGRSLDTEPPTQRLVVLGGSSGARVLNENMPRALAKIRSRLSGWEILHQAGECDLQTTTRRYRDYSVSAKVVPFIADMPAVLAAADLAVSRAGGTTLSELAAAGVPPILLPYPHAANDHQLRNAEVFAAAGGAITLDERRSAGCVDARLADLLAELLHDRSRRTRMATAIRRLARPNAAARVADLIVDVVLGQSHDQAYPAAA